MSKVYELKRAHAEAVDYVGMVGRREEHLKSHGRIHKLAVSTEICFQHAPSTKNYWTDEAFDKALSKAVLANWRTLSAEALEMMKSEYIETYVGTKEQLLSQLREIEALEAEVSRAAS